MGLKVNFDSLFNQALTYQVAHAADAEALAEAKKRFHAWTRTNLDEIHSGYCLEDPHIESCKELADQWKERFETLVIFGIGGSSLGAKSIYNALHPTLEDSKHLYFVENLDPVCFTELWKNIDLKRTGFVVISKSGGTIESLASFSSFYKELIGSGADLKKQVLAITDPKEGVLRQWAQDEELPSLGLASSIGGRFSVFSPVGFFPLAFCGIDIEALHRGAEAQWNFEGGISEDDFWKLSQRLWELWKEKVEVHNLMPYATLLGDFSKWAVQLIGESLGKNQVARNPVGLTPLASIGSTDQHSLLQLLVDGPNNFCSHFIKIKNWPENSWTFEELPPQFEEKLGWAYGRSFSEILNTQCEATQKALAEKSKAHFEIELKHLDAENLGSLYAFYMDWVSAMGAFEDINPYDQPGVERGKGLLKLGLSN